MSLAGGLPGWPARPGRRELLAAGAVALTATGCLALAQALGKPLLAVLAPLGLAVIPALLRRQRWMLGVLGAVEVANLGTIAEEHGFSNLHLALVTIALAGVVLHWVRNRRAPVWSPVLWFAGVYFVTRAVSVLAAADRAAAASSLLDLGKDLVFLAVVLALCWLAAGEGLLARVIVSTGAALCLLVVIQQYLLSNSTTFFGLSRPASTIDIGLTFGRHAGPLTDHNFWGRVLIVLIPLALSLFADRSSARRHWWLAAFGLLLAGVYLTGSRGTWLVTAVVIVLWLILAGPRYRRLLLAAPLLAGALLLVPGVGSRLASIGDVSTTAESQADLSLIGRVQVQKLGWYMFLEHPAVGVGAANFVVVEPDYQRRYGIDLPTSGLAPHDLYLELAAESGVLGLTGWLGLYGSGLFLAVRARLLTRRPAPADEPSAEWLLTGGVIAGLAGWGLVSILLHLATFRVLVLVLVIAAALDARARRSAAARAGQPRWRPGMLLHHVVPRRASGRRTRQAVALAAFATVAGLGLLAPGAFTRQWAATTELRIGPQAGDSTPSAYSLATMSREPLVLTYLSLLGDDHFQRQAESSLQLSPAQRAATTVTASTSSPPGLLVVTVVGPAPDVARAMATEVPARVIAYLDGLRPFYTLHEVPAPGAASRPMTVLRPAMLGAVVFAASASAGAWWALAGGRQRPVRRPGTSAATTGG